MQQSRESLKALKAAARRGDADAARLVLAHSVALGHDRLAVRRYFMARALGVSDLDDFEPFCQRVAQDISPIELAAMARDAVAFVERISKRRQVPMRLVDPHRC